MIYLSIPQLQTILITLPVPTAALVREVVAAPAASGGPSLFIRFKWFTVSVRPHRLVWRGRALGLIFIYRDSMEYELNQASRTAIWPRRAIELMAIVISILLSFFLEDLRQENEEKEKKDDLVKDLRLVVTEDQKQIAAHVTPSNNPYSASPAYKTIFPRAMKI